MIIRSNGYSWFVVAVMASCTEQAASPATESASNDNVRVGAVHNSAPLWTPDEAWHLGSTPRIEIGSDETRPGHAFTRISSAFRLRAGRIIVGNSNNPPELRAFNPSGDAEWIVGGEGGGPGEFRNVFWVQPIAFDSLLVYDPFGARLTTIDWGGNLLGTESLASVGQSGGVAASIMFGRFEDGSFLAHANRMFEATELGFNRDTSAWTRVWPGEARADTVGHFPGWEYHSNGPRESAAIAFGLRFVVGVHDDRVYVGAGDTFRVDVYDPDGQWQRSFSRDHERRPVRRSDVEAFIEQELASIPYPSDRVHRERQFREHPAADSMPAHGVGLLVDPEGNVWVEEFFAPGDSAPYWSVFRRDGRFLGSVRMPDGLKPTDIGVDYVLGTWKNELDVQHVRLYDLTKPQA